MWFCWSDYLHHPFKIFSLLTVFSKMSLFVCFFLFCLYTTDFKWNNPDVTEGQVRNCSHVIFSLLWAFKCFDTQVFCVFVCLFVFYWQEIFCKIPNSSEPKVPVHNTMVKVCNLNTCFQADLTHGVSRYRERALEPEKKLFWQHFWQHHRPSA